MKALLYLGINKFKIIFNNFDDYNLDLIHNYNALCSKSSLNYMIACFQCYFELCFFFVIPYYSLMWRLILFNYFSHKFCPPRSPRPHNPFNKQTEIISTKLSFGFLKPGFFVFLLFLDNSLRLFFFYFAGVLFS